jgi:hypothetical protein
MNNSEGKNSRLYFILNNCLRFAKDKSLETKFGQILCESHGLSYNLENSFNLYAQLILSIEQLKIEILASSHSIEKLNDTFSKLHSVLNVSPLGGSWSNFANSFSERDLIPIYWASVSVFQNKKLKNPNKEEIVVLSQKLEDLISDFLGSNIENELKSYILQCLYSIRETIRLHDYIGSESILIESDKLIGILFRFSRGKNKQKVNSVFEKLFAFIGYINSIIESVENYGKILEFFKDSLEKVVD